MDLETDDVELVRSAESITHLHLLSILATEIGKRAQAGGRVRVLDAGCGNGHLLTFLQANLAALFPELEIEIHGYDVADHGVQAQDYFSTTLTWCRESCPAVLWEERLKLITQDDAWPFDSDYFDFVISNQVIEHVSDHRHFFAEHARVLKKGGCGAHLFPLRHYIYEGHLLIPLAHKISDWYFLRCYIRVMSRLGFGKYRRQNGGGLDEFSERHADYMMFFTNYLSHSELMAVVKRSRLRPSLKYTVDFYRHKVRQLLGRDVVLKLDVDRRTGLGYWLSYHILKFVSSITLFVENENTYQRVQRDAS